MVIEYLNGQKKELLEKKAVLEREIKELELRLRDTGEFIKVLQESCDSGYESFSPRDGNIRERDKIEELREEQKKSRELLEEKQQEYEECLQKLGEVSNVIEEAGQKIKDSSSLVEDETYRLTILETQENERQRISRELHDYTVQNMISLVHKTELCTKLVEIDAVRCKLELNIISKTLRDIINDTRNMIYNLRPMSFDDIGLVATIERALDKLESSEAKKINFSVKGEPYSIKSVIGITLLRILQEGCSNAIRHANSSYIKVVLQYEKNKIILLIEDDGIGFDSENIECEIKKDNSGFGLSMMKERVYLLSGSIEIDSKVDCGTKIRVEVPITE